MTQKPFSNIKIHELEKIRNSSSIQIINKALTSFSLDNRLYAIFSYKSSSIYTKYIALQIKPSLNVSNLIVASQCIVDSFDLIDGNWITIDKLYSNVINLFFIEVTELTKINISLLINADINNTNYEYEDDELPPIGTDGGPLELYLKDSYSSDYIDINIYEYEKKINNNSYIIYTSKNSKRLKRVNDNYYTNEMIIQVNNSNTNYFAFALKPDYGMKSIQANMIISGGLFLLFNNIPKIFTKLKSNENYLFYTTAKQLSYARLTITINYNSSMSTKLFNGIYCQGLVYKDDYKKSKGNYKSITPIIDGDKLIISASYNNSMSAINYILFFTTPLYNIDYMSVNIDVTDCLIDLENYKNFNGKYYFLKSQYKYYIKMNAWKNYITKLNLKAYNVSKAPFSSILIRECYYENGVYGNINECEKKSTQKIKFKKINDRYEATFEKKNTLDRHLYLFIEIIPECDIQYIVAETKINEYFKISTSTLIITIIIIIILIIMILYIIIHFIKCLSLKSKQLSLKDLAPNQQNEQELISPN